MTHADTIVALSSPIQQALRAIIRLSGDRAFELVAPLLDDGTSTLRHARAVNVNLNIGEGLVYPATVYPFRAPRSSTGEDVVELHVPASPFLVSETIRRLIAGGARQAEPGEFTARAFFNAKLDLTAAEGVAATIAASNRAELDAARRLLGGELARRIVPLMEELVAALALIEVGIDFTEEDVTFLSRDELHARLGSVREQLTRLRNESPRLERLSHEPRLLLCGRPNAGKSTLLNALAGEARAVVSDVAGTTRDVLSARVALRRGYVQLLDIAGIEQGGDDEISRQMQSRALRAIETADLVVLLVDAADRRERIVLPREPDLVVHTKRDLAEAPEGALSIDARHGEGLDILRGRLDELAFGPAVAATSALALSGRHRLAIDAALESIGRAVTVEPLGELIAAELRSAINALGSIVGSVSPDDVLGRIFSGFCIGK